MIADLIDDALDLRFITRNVMAVYSTDIEYTDFLIRKLKHSHYVVNDKIVSSDLIISYIKKNYNLYENISRFVKRHKHFNYSKFVEYLDFLDLNHLLWLHFYQLNSENLSVIEILLQLSTDKKIVITDYIDDFKCKTKLYTLLFHAGLEDKLLIVPFKHIDEAVNNSTCQCYIKSYNSAKIQSKFSNEYLNAEFNSSEIYYNGLRPKVYEKTIGSIIPIIYSYTLYELLLIFLFNLKMLCIQLYNWRLKVT